MTSAFADKNNARVQGTRTHSYSGVPSCFSDDEPAEKPYHRVLDKVTKKGRHLYEPVTSVPSPALVILLGFYLLLAYFAQLIEDGMPRPVQISSLAADNSDTFSEEAALSYLNAILGGQPRVSGTANHLHATSEMKRIVDGISSAARIPVRTDWQMATDDYYLEMAYPLHNYYRNCSNVIAVLEGESGFHANGTIGSSILVNCHYDSVPYAIGASDDGVFCAVMTESLNKLSKRSTRLKHNVIFLFNGAEENLLQGSHAFLQHPWSKGVISLINLDSAGMNGHPTLFQATDSRVLSAYSSVARAPTAQGLAEFLFKSGIIPSDTDFRIFRDFGDMQGIDIAFSKWANVYHTRNDRPELLLAGVVQGAGDMLLNLIARVADMEELSTKIEPTTSMYYDFFSSFMWLYSVPWSYVLDILFVLIGLASVYYYLWLVGLRWSSVRELALTAAGRVACIFSGTVVTLIFTALMVATTVQMRYLSNPWIVVPLYWLPYTITTIAVSQTIDAKRPKQATLSRSLRTLQAMSASRLALSLLTLALVCVPPVSNMRYLLSVPLFIMSLTSFISITLVRTVRLAGWQHLILEVLLSVPLMMWLLSLVLRLDAMMLPITGRSSSDTPDYTVAFLNLALCMLVSTVVSGIELLFSRKYLWAVLGTVGAVVVVLMFIPFSPYDEDGVAVQRHYWFHSEIASFDINGNRVSETTGVLVTKVDPHTLKHVPPALSSAGYNLDMRTDFKSDCENLVYCGLPTYRTSFGNNLRNSLFLSTGGPSRFDPLASFTVESKACSGNSCTYNFIMRGGAHNLLSFWPYPNITISQWSLATPPRSSFTQLSRPVYVMFHSTATHMTNWSERFTITLDVPPSLQSGPIVEVSHHSHRLYHPEHYTTEYARLLQAMPHYFNIASIMSFRYNYVF